MFFCYFDHAHWQRVMAARKAQGLNRLSELSKFRPDHPLMNAWLREHSTGKDWRVISVRQDWWLGHYLIARLECEGLQQECVVENLSSCQPDVDIQLAHFLKNFHAQPIMSLN